MYMRPDMSNPIDRLAHLLSEIHNPNAPIGWNTYRGMASLLMDKFDILDTVMDKRFLYPEFRAGNDARDTVFPKVSEALIAEFKGMAAKVSFLRHRTLTEVVLIKDRGLSTEFHWVKQFPFETPTEEIVAEMKALVEREPARVGRKP